MRACAYRLYIFPAQAPVHVLEAFHAGKTINKAAILLVVTVAEHIGDDAILARYCTPNHADVREHNLKNFNISSISESISQYAASLYNSVYLYAHAGICCCCTCVLRVSMCMQTHAAAQLLAQGGNANDGEVLAQFLANTSFDGIEQRACGSGQQRRCHRALPDHELQD